ncbi:hypothetical protein MLD38_002998 [Melastoma candidum]|uniref:Uncharacterized protein n=1 Tax=Melastoma candidum TaxID=119954 RepID=A0ACB9S1B9_9MYRT|nr:hypothetical protein MLD38_002998 [Melastoma candidum]
MEKHGQVIAVDNEVNGLSLNLGEHGFPVTESDAADWERSNGKKAMISGASTGRATCQVEECGADLSSAEDYHRRHKVCELHSKTSKALVGGALQRFCQQCSRHCFTPFQSLMKENEVAIDV